MAVFEYKRPDGAFIAPVAQQIVTKGGALSDVVVLDETAVASAANTADEAQAAALAAQKAVSALTAGNEGASGGGISFTETFEYGPGPLSSNWVVGNPSAIGALEKPLAAGMPSTMPKSTKAWWARHIQPTKTDAQSVRVVLANSGSNYDQALTFIILRAAADMSSFVYVAAWYGGIELGKATSSGGEIVSRQVWRPASTGAARSGATIEARAVGPVYTVKVNGSPVITYSDTSVTSPVGASNRHVGIGFGLHIDWLGIGWLPACIASFSVSDVDTPAVQGTGWSFYRAATGTATLSGSGDRAHNVTVYDVKRYASNVTVGDVGTGRVVIEKAGWYTVTIRAQEGTNTGAVLLYGAPSLSENLALIRRGPTNVYSLGGETSVYARGTAGTFLVYCPVGYVLQAGYGNENNGTGRLVGDPAGTLTFFEGALTQGPQGLQGIQGARGEAGPVGPQGEQGEGLRVDLMVEDYAEIPAVGTPGDTVYVINDGLLYVYTDAWPAQGFGMSLLGPQGERGATGATGPKGDTGATGATGPKGDVGPQGVKGDKGDRGDKGDTGPQGVKGETGTAWTGTQAAYDALPNPVKFAAGWLGVIV